MVVVVGRGHCASNCCKPLMWCIDVGHWCGVYTSLDYEKCRSRSRSRRYGSLVAFCIREWEDQRFKVVSVEQENEAEYLMKEESCRSTHGDNTQGRWYSGGLEFCCSEDMVILRRESRLSKPKTTLNRLWVSIISCFLLKHFIKVQCSLHTKCACLWYHNSWCMECMKFLW